MSLYSTIDRRINADLWFRGLSQLAQLLWFRILTGPHVTPVAGLWAVPGGDEGMSRAFGIPIDQFRAAFDELSREPSRNGFARVIADWQAGVIWVPNSLSIPSNRPANLNVLTSWGQYVELVPECPLKTQALRYFRTWVQQNRNRYKRVPVWLADGQGLVSPQDQEQDQEQEGVRARAREETPPPPADSEGNPEGEPEEFSPPATRRHIRAFERGFQTTVESWSGWTPKQSKRLVTCGKDPALLAEKFVASHKSSGKRSSDWEAEAETWVLSDEERAAAIPKPAAAAPDQLGGRGFD